MPPRAHHAALPACILSMLCISGRATAGASLDEALTAIDRMHHASISASYHDAPLEQVLRELSAQCPVPIDADWSAVDLLFIEEDDTVSLELRGASAMTALRAVAAQLGEAYSRPIFEYSGGRMVLTTIPATASMRETAVYDVGDLVLDVDVRMMLEGELGAARVDDEPEVNGAGVVHPEDVDPQDVDPEAVDSDGDDAEAPGEDDAGVGMADVSGGDDEEPAADAAAPARPASPRSAEERLVLTLIEHVDPEAWINFGGTHARIDGHHGSVLVSAPPSVHYALREVLQELRRAHGTSIAIDASLIEIDRQTFTLSSRRHRAGTNALARALLNDQTATLRWRAEGEAVVIGQVLDLRSSEGETHGMRLQVKPMRDEEHDLLQLAVEATFTQGGAQRAVKTIVPLVDAMSAVIVELPSVGDATAGERALVLVVLPSRM